MEGLSTPNTPTAPTADLEGRRSSPPGVTTRAWYGREGTTAVGWEHRRTPKTCVSVSIFAKKNPCSFRLTRYYVVSSTEHMSSSWTLTWVNAQWFAIPHKCTSWSKFSVLVYTNIKAATILFSSTVRRNARLPKTSATTYS